MKELKPELVYTLYKLDWVYPEELPTYAVTFIENGIENKHMIELAGLNKPTQSDIRDLVDKAFAPYLPDKFDHMTMALIIAKAIIDEDIDTYKGAYLIGELSEELNRCDDLWIFKCNIIQFDDYYAHNLYERLGNETQDLVKLRLGEIIIMALQAQIFIPNLLRNLFLKHLRCSNVLRMKTKQSKRQ
ncbi:MAG: hypothetical protein M9949_05815 [Candidatus Kapabacteria bacterium]|nr:hypothetical protein [Candidatus Kapabacteria bacterium]